VRAAVGSDYPIVLRYSQWKQQDFSVKLAPTPQELEAFLAPLTAAGVDCYHCSQRRYWEPEFEGSELNLAGWTKKLSGKPTITVGSIGLDQEFIASYGTDEASKPATIDGLLERLERGEFDLAAVGRALIANPDWPQLVREGRLEQARPYERAILAELR
jgi:2,4-dienoyl-CoA reductase-like NADH-dependent reductase (Old Yellow Enzyme family)